MSKCKNYHYEENKLAEIVAEAMQNHDDRMSDELERMLSGSITVDKPLRSPEITFDDLERLRRELDEASAINRYSALQSVKSFDLVVGDPKKIVIIDP